MASFFIPLTGLESDSTALNTIANDLANLNTTAFKDQAVNFSDLFYQQIGKAGSGDPIQVGAGVQVASIETAFTQGSMNTTGNATDVALNGNGFFVVDGGNGVQDFTRAGNFSLDATGNLITANGQQVLGYPAVNGVINTTSTLAAINIPVGQVEQPQATTSLNMVANLDATSATGTAFPAQITIYDSLGVNHVATVTYKQTAANTWSYSVALPAGDFTSGISTPVTGSMSFNSSGTLSSITPTGGVLTPVGSGTGQISSIPLAFTGLADGAANLGMKWNLLGANGTPTISQVDSASAVSSTVQNGFPSGEYQSFTIAADGSVTATYSNGQQQSVGQLALANVANLQGLTLQGNGDYSANLATGTPSIGVSGTNGLATIQDGALEESNVNISAEFADLIIAQRAFEANSKAVTTFDSVTQDTINMIH
jgi:flagellar hook protein FlgE